MRFKHLFFPNRSLSNVSKSSRYATSPSPFIYQNASSTSSAQHLLGLKIPNFLNPNSINPLLLNLNSATAKSIFTRKNHSLQLATPIDTETHRESDELDSEDGIMSEFLSYFVWIMRGKLAEAYPDCDKPTINGMLLIIVERVVEELDKGGMDEMVGPTSTAPSRDFSDDLWKTVWEVSNLVLEDMKKERKKESMKKYMQHEEVKEMCRFASEVGVRGNMLRNFRFKWAKEKMEEVEFYENLERMRVESHAQEREEEEEKTNQIENVLEEVSRDGSDVGLEVKPKVVSLPQRRGKIKYKIHGLDMSGPEWAEVAFRYHEAEKRIMPEEPKAITGKCKLVTENILNLAEDEDPSIVLAEWVELLKPGRVDWFHLLDNLRQRSMGLYVKIAEMILDEDSFQANIRDYSRLVDLHAKDNRIDDAERILIKMGEKGIEPDILTTVTLFHMYSKAGNIERAKEAFTLLRRERFYMEDKAYNTMIMAYVNARQHKSGAALLRDMEGRNIKATEEVFMALLKAFSEDGHPEEAQRIITAMHFAGLPQTLASWTLLIEAYVRSGNEHRAKDLFKDMRRHGLSPDDRSTASMISMYEKKNSLDKALNLLLELEKGGFEPGVATYTVLLHWLVKLLLVDEAEEVLRKIIEKGVTPPIKVQVGLCEMYARSRDEKKALQALGVLEGKKELLEADDFERIIIGLKSCGLRQDAIRVHKMMESRGFKVSESVRVPLMAFEATARRPRVK